LKSIKKIGIIGEGKMGTSIFLYLNHFDYKLYWLCSSEEASNEARKLFVKKMKSQLHCAVLTEQEYVAKVERTVITANPADLADCDLVIEAIPEDINLKRKLFEVVETLINPDCIFTTNSSSIIPSKLIPSVNREDKFAGLHFFFPVQLKKYLELIRGDDTTTETINTLNDFLALINKKSFIQHEKFAFLLNRLFLDYQAGAYQIYLEGRLSYREIDQLVKTHLFPFGIFEFFDHVGIDVMLASVKAYADDAPNKEFYSPLIEKMEQLIKENRMGIKTKQGFYDYDQPVKRENQDLEHLPDPYERQVLDQLWGYYINSVQIVLDSGIIEKDELAEAIKDYTGIEVDPFICSF
jgi:3-hydroxybutyryl-CoA dehydrogenase